MTKSFRQRDMTRAIKAARLAGLNVERVEVDKDGKIIVVTGQARDAGRRGGADSALPEGQAVAHPGAGMSVPLDTVRRKAQYASSAATECDHVA